MTSNNKNLTTSTIYERTEGDIPLSDRPQHKFYADRNVHEHLRSIPLGNKNRFINKAITEYLKTQQGTRGESLKDFAEYLKRDRFKDNKAAQALIPLLTDFYLDRSLNEGWE